jgi:hypothetical protein
MGQGNRQLTSDESANKLRQSDISSNRTFADGKSSLS